MQGTSESKTALLTDMINSMLDIEFALMVGSELELGRFEYVIDGRMKKPQRYMGLITEECV